MNHCGDLLRSGLEDKFDNSLLPCSCPCPNPRTRSRRFELMDLSGQALEGLNQLMKRRSLSNRRMFLHVRCARALVASRNVMVLQFLSPCSPIFSNLLTPRTCTATHTNTHKHTHRRHSKNRNTGAAPKQKIGLGLVEQVATQHAAREDTAGMIPGTARQRKTERAGRSEDRLQLAVKQVDYLNAQLDRHKIGVRKLAEDWPCVW